MFQRFQRSMIFVLFVLFGNLANAETPPMRDDQRGELLYTTHCIACHSDQVYWRDKKLAKDWKTLQSQVRHWDRFAELGWTDDDVVVVARYLNVLYYHYPTPE